MNTKLDSRRLDEMDNTKLSPLDTFPKPEGSGQSPCQLQSWPQPSGSSWSSLDFPEVCSSAHKLSCCLRPLAVHLEWLLETVDVFQGAQNQSFSKKKVVNKRVKIKI